ncbi:glial cell line-derived neurotrophic factor [Microcaecilia unicolor]|uniref:Glial cell line-derived neurotrophic factor n=1 Tax=Microcaecilia unicolor TaxID=1415580 RepID=A0A6P7X3S3_9AMPH|nr:glial cell line-derived neurotrophic factor [Microcaecilia unicolor]
MKLWAVVAFCVLLLSSMSSTPLPASWQAGKKHFHVPASLEEEEQSLPVPQDLGEVIPHPYLHSNTPDHYLDQLDDVMEFIQTTIKRIRRSSDRQTPVLSKRQRNRQIAAAANTENSSRKMSKDKRRKNRNCVLREIHLNVTDLDLGYETKEELIFRYCSGSCNTPETTYDQILKNLVRNKKLVNDKVKQACCRPIAFDDALSFLDDRLVYHTLKQHSAKKCGCI